MENYDIENMKRAIDEAWRCEPIEDRIPKVGAIIAIGSTIIGLGHRGTGRLGDDDHAEKVALLRVADRSQLPNATIYTTLEPCTPEVRSAPLECCTKLIGQAEVKKVYIGILDPNQGVRGKGLWELQEKGIGVELFPPELARDIRVMNQRFVRVQQTLGLRFTHPEAGASIRTSETGGIYEFRGKFLNEPGTDVVAFTNINNHWWPQPHRLVITGNNQWTVKVHFGKTGPHVVSLVRLSDLGRGLVNYYWKMVDVSHKRDGALKNNFTSNDDRNFLNSLSGAYQSIVLDKLPKGLELQAQVEVTIE